MAAEGVVREVAVLAVKGDLVPPGETEVAGGIGFTGIMVPAELGPGPAWQVPGDGDTGTVAVHGQDGRRKAQLKILPVVHRLGLPFMTISYRSDEGAPPSPYGLLRHAQTMGARLIGCRA